jgi:1,3-beta-glucanosyltransferase GAS5
MLDAAGIYLALDANTPLFSLNRESLETLHQSYNDVYLQSVFSTIENFAGYSMFADYFEYSSRANVIRQPSGLLLR